MTPACTNDYRALARARLPGALFDYIDGGAYDETTLARNTGDLAALALRQRVLNDVSTLSTGTELFGQTLAMPVALGPVGMAGMYARRGEVQAARAAAGAGVPFSLSTVSVCDVAEVKAGAGTPPWFQLYMIRDRAYMADLLAAVREAGCPVLLFTVDLPAMGARYRDVRSGMSGAPSRLASVRRALDGLAHPAWLADVFLGGRPHAFGNLIKALPDARGMAEFGPWLTRNLDPAVSWKDIEWVRSRWPGPLVIKGVLDPQDARQAVSAGADGLVVSNHGGRQLDGVLSGIAALPPIVQAAGDELTILMDGGVRSGLDVLKALASGAKACLLGRAWAWPLAARGEAGVAHMLRIVRQELKLAMMLTGCTDVRAAGRDLLVGG